MNTGKKIYLPPRAVVIPARLGTLCVEIGSGSTDKDDEIFSKEHHGNLEFEEDEALEELPTPTQNIWER